MTSVPLSSPSPYVGTMGSAHCTQAVSIPPGTQVPWDFKGDDLPGRGACGPDHSCGAQQA